MHSVLQAPRALRPPVRVPIPKYKGYGDSVSANDFLDALLHYQQATGMVDQEILGRVLPIALTDQAARWFRLCGQNALTLDQFRAQFRQEFLPADYERRMRRELERRTQHPDESLLEYVRTMQELYLLADPSAPHSERVERVIRQAHPTFSAYLRGSRFHTLDDLALEARRIQGDILAARAYRPPPPPSATLEPRCAWNGDSVSPHSRPADASAAYADARGRVAPDVSDRALDPYSYGLRRATAKSQSSPHSQDRVADLRREERRLRNEPIAQNERRNHPRPAARNPLGPEIRCYRCDRTGHIARNCTNPQASGNGPSRR
ncbi:unnamed protein product [Ixodes hexagonus]